MIIIKSPREIKLMREAGIIVGKIFDEVEKMVAPGISTMDISNAVEKVIEENGAKSAEKGYCGFPGYVCVSVNEELIHGIPSKKRILHDGDIVSVDVVVEKDGYNADACRTYTVGIMKQEVLDLVRVTKECFEKAVEAVHEGARLGDVSHAIEAHAKAHGYSVPLEYTGHGIGREMHEDPYIPNYGEVGTGPFLKAGMTLAIEPMIMSGRHDCRVLKDGWTVVSRDGKPSAHYENTIVVTKDGYEILTKI